jgi:hypothetical protein
MPAYGNRRARAGRLRVRRSPLEGGAGPRARRSLLEVSAPPRARRSLFEGRRAPSSEVEPVRGDLLVGRPGGPSGPPWRGPCLVCLSEVRLALVVVGFKRGFPSLFKGTLGLSPTVAPEHLRVCH